MNSKTTTVIVMVALLMMCGLANAQDLTGANAAFDREDYDTAIGQYQQLAQAGDKFAQYRYAMMNYFGLGTQKDNVTAYSWMTTAAEDQIEVVKKFQLLIWDELDRDQQDAGTELAIKNERAAGTEIMDRRAKTERRRAERSKCTGSRVGNCGAIEAFGVSFSNRGVIRAKDIPHSMTAEEAEAFEEQYNSVILHDFAKFDSE